MQYSYVFTLSKVVDFITLVGHNNLKEKQYVLNRILELSGNKKLTAYKFIQTETRMPKDSEVSILIPGK